ncbi:hypothetical protein [Bradyrhizobium sp. BRP56]|uniref:hypothetical protein n=1 Tax=Bradyrhizobium sp. BRP56 TaxID=2793819 RepID=UPI001CD33BC7|nr:hypothetical protein [Bradyrhizobium sp. BRP56]MCA1396118.1 hypothetical protein [Bradyrhizobium sp. BRP56]
MAVDEAIIEAERAIDQAFEASPLLSLPSNQAMWTVLAVNEDIFLRLHTERPHEEMHMVADTLLNSLTHPLRTCMRRWRDSSSPVRRTYVPDDYGHAWQWLKLAEQYDQFCSIFPLWHRKRLKLSVKGKRLLSESVHKDDKTYEAYNRLIRKEGRDDPVLEDPPAELLQLLRDRTKLRETWFRLKFDREVVARLVDFHREPTARRFTLPDDWRFLNFSLKEYRTVMVTMQSMMHGWYLVRTMVANDGMRGMGYPSSVWLLDKDDLANQLAEYTNVPRPSLEAILDLVTFGSNGILNPDVATQPLIGLGNNQVALAPFVFLNLNVERNLCTLLNQIKEERDHYSRLVDMKEDALIGEIRQFLADTEFEVITGKLPSTDVDCAIVDRNNRCCLCLELKWFIEPAEIREIGDRTKDLKKGLTQARHLNELFRANDQRLRQLLGINSAYDFLSAVGSVNWIGMADVQDPSIPIVKVWHLMGELKEKGLPAIMSWLRQRDYLPKPGRDFNVVSLPIKVGDWSADWYGITAPNSEH